MSQTVLVFVKQVPDTQNITGDAMTPEGTVNRAALPAIFQQQVIAAIEDWFQSRDWASAKQVIIPKVMILGVFYFLSLCACILQTQLMAIITQGFLGKMRKTMFNGMQNLPIKYFDTNKHGDIMSHYTNDIDTLRQLISQSIPAILQAGLIVISVFFIKSGQTIFNVNLTRKGNFLCKEI